jgi:hypothetical protein
MISPEGDTLLTIAPSVSQCADSPTRLFPFALNKNLAGPFGRNGAARVFFLRKLRQKSVDLAEIAAGARRRHKPCKRVFKIIYMQDKDNISAIQNKD